MKRAVLLFAVIMASISVRSHAQTAAINLEAGQLLTSGSTAMQDGFLVQLIGDTSSSPAAPTATSFTGTSTTEVVLDSFTMNSSSLGAGQGSFLDTLTVHLTGSNGIAAGSYLYLRWYPTLNGSATQPGGGTTYGQFTSSSIEYPADSAATAWVMPSGGSNVDIDFLTLSVDNQGDGTASNPPPNSAGLASFTVAAVPEPATFTLMAGALALGAMVWRRRT